jgi:hypothetical protein
MAIESALRAPAAPKPVAPDGPAIWLSPGGEGEMITRTETPTARLRQAGDVTSRSRIRFGLPLKISVFLAAILIPLAS